MKMILGLLYPTRGSLRVFGENPEVLRWGIGDGPLIELFHPVQFVQILSDANGKLPDVVRLRIIFPEHLLENASEVFEARDEAGRRAHGINLAMDAKLHPFDPDVFVADAVDELAVLVAEKVVDAEDRRGFA